MVTHSAKRRGPKPEVKLASDFRQRGKYKRFSQLLDRGEVLLIDSEKEAMKVRQKWMANTPKVNRDGRKCFIEPAGNKYRVIVRKS